MINVLELKAEIEEKYPNLTDHEIILYMDGYMDGLTRGYSEASERAKEIIGETNESV